MIFIETTVNITMAEFLNPPKLQFLNKLLPCEPNKVQSKAILPQLLAQVNIFNCGGIAIALCNLHTILDACSINAFLKTWTAICREKRDEISWPDFSSPSSLFPPKTSISCVRAGVLNISSSKVEAKCTIARFLFDNQAINDLRDEAKDGETTPNPTRYQALSAFVSKHLILACRPESGESVRPAVLLHVLDMRRRMSDSLCENSIGNLLWPAVEFCDKVNENIELKGLVKSLRDNIGKHSNEFFARVQCDPNFLWSDEAAELMLEGMVVERPIAFVFTSWCNMGFNELNFGLGKPLWIGLRGGNQETIPNSVVFVDTREGIEAWLTMQEQHMTNLEKDEEFLRFAVPNPNVPSI
ncbi:hypothetical protein L6164_005778 [Bauhinia variegata]|uniref:Uncharacterized protein n=1 Tax=Bauhinia variegata TaxID=167791 RepID=A0ACB9PU77_BAUVA|nr:hypothetical protein L6164_005778 [Bauhinia variegata]